MPHDNPYEAPRSTVRPVPLDDPNEAAPSASGAIFGWAFVGVVAVLNVYVVNIAAADRSWGALAIALIWGPAMNAALAVVASILMLPLWSKPGFCAGSHLLISFAVPAGAAVIDLYAIFSMDLHGC